MECVEQNVSTGNCHHKCWREKGYRTRCLGIRIPISVGDGQRGSEHGQQREAHAQQPRGRHGVSRVASSRESRFGVEGKAEEATPAPGLKTGAFETPGKRGQIFVQGRRRFSPEVAFDRSGHHVDAARRGHVRASAFLSAVEQISIRNSSVSFINISRNLLPVRFAAFPVVSHCDVTIIFQPCVHVLPAFFR